MLLAIDEAQGCDQVLMIQVTQVYSHLKRYKENNSVSTPLPWLFDKKDKRREGKERERKHVEKGKGRKKHLICRAVIRHVQQKGAKIIDGPVKGNLKLPFLQLLPGRDISK